MLPSVEQKSRLFSLIERCRGCHAPANSMREVLSMDPMPLAGMFCNTKEEAAAAPVFPLTWIFCPTCGLVQVREDVADDFLFSKYNYSSSTVGGLVKHFEGYADFLSERYHTEKLALLEIGCNDGVLLNRLPPSWRLIGCDPSDVSAVAAQDAAYELLNRPFTIDTVLSSHLESAIDVITGSNCLAHISDLKAVFESVRLALRPGGHFWIEVHDLEALLQGSQWDTIYHEHKVEWSEESLCHCLTRLGFVHRETLRTPMHGGALRICFEKSELSATVANAIKQPHAGLGTLRRAYETRYETAAVQQLIQLSRHGQKFAAYGAAGRANVYLNQLQQLPFEYIVDESPLRMNKFIPHVGTPIVPASELTANPVPACLITAWNYRDDIIRKNPSYKGRWLTAFGAPT